MSGLSGLTGGLANSGLSSGLSSGGGLSGGLGNSLDGGDVGAGGSGAGGVGGVGGMPAPNRMATSAEGQSFGDTLKTAIIDKPSAVKAGADDLAARLAAGENVDSYKVAIETAKAGVEIQMSTRTISQAVSAVRTLFQMQI